MHVHNPPIVWPGRQCRCSHHCHCTCTCAQCRPVVAWPPPLYVPYIPVVCKDDYSEAVDRLAGKRYR